MVYDKHLSLEENSLKISFEGKLLRFSSPLYIDINRYFLPMLEFINQLEGTVNITGSKITIKFKKKVPISLDYKLDDYKFIVSDSILYLSLFDLCRILNIKSRWNYPNSTISLYWDKEKHVSKNTKKSGRIALIRFEDVTARPGYVDAENLEKFRIMGDYLFSSGIPFHVTWIPRFIDPPNKIDNDISKNNSMPNAHFLFTLEYLLNRNGVIGLHGYTHQYGDEVSAEGTEFDEERNNDEASVRKRVEAAINTANKLELPFKFFESPHYASTEFQQSIFEQYFDIIYEGCVGIWGEKIVTSPRNNKTIYVPTPLSYVQGEVEEGTKEMIDRINNLEEDSLASLFYHPDLEFEYITLSSDSNGYPLSSYSENSPLHRITQALIKKGCSFTKVTDLGSDSSNTKSLLSYLSFYAYKLYDYLKSKFYSIK
ncbi:MAG: DUF2334 domain-containing protein [Clostridiaceae bacterium]